MVQSNQQPIWNSIDTIANLTVTRSAPPDNSSILNKIKFLSQKHKLPKQLDIGVMILT